jgi:hypothetical protein
MTYFIQISKDNGKSWSNVRSTPDRTRAFDAYSRWSEGNRARLFKNNTMILATHIEDAQKELNSLTHLPR